MAEKKLTNEKKRELAKIMFLDGKLSQKEIADIVGISENSMTKWAQDGKWDDIRTEIVTTDREMITMLKKMLRKKIDEGNLSLEDDDPKTNPDEDGINKLAKSIHYLEKKTSTGQMYETGSKFLTFLQKHDHILAKQVAPLFHAFIKSEL